MVVIDLKYKEGQFFELESSGHANGGSVGNDLACASISSLLLAFAGALTEQVAIKSELNSRGRGHLYLKVKQLPPELNGWLAGLEAGLTCGLARIKKEYPNALSVNSDKTIILGD